MRFRGGPTPPRSPEDDPNPGIELVRHLVAELPGLGVAVHGAEDIEYAHEIRCEVDGKPYEITVGYDWVTGEPSMNPTDRSGVIHVAEAQQGIPGPAGERSVVVLQRGSLDVKLSCPVPPNEQTPHVQDEIYVILRGRGVLVHDGKRDPFEAGDLLFVAAGVPHHYEDFTADLALWRVFYGPAGGELPA